MKSSFQNQGLLINGILFLSPKEAEQELQNNAYILDIREEVDIYCRMFDVKNILYCPDSKFDELYESIPKDIPVIIADSYGMRSKERVKTLIEKGYSNLAVLNGGIRDWERDGLPVIKNANYNGQCLCMTVPKKIKKK